MVRAGAPATAWQIVARALPALLATSPAPRGLPDLLALGAQAVTAAGPAGPITGLAQLAGRGGSTRLVTEARRLLRLLPVEEPQSSNGSNRFA